MVNRSFSTIGNPEFINIKPYNPLISKCEIKVMYVGENRNKSYITKEVATELANSLPGNPIVGYYLEDKKDFSDHGERIIIDDDGLHFKCMTRPYGFVAPDAKVWFQKFQELDAKSQEWVVREYLMTTGYLWTGQYPECQAAVDEGKPHSMEFDKDTLDGTWSKNINPNVELFIVNDGLFSKLCILGDDVEPCFEGSSVTAPEVSAHFTKDEKEFMQTLYSMMQELKFALKGEQEMIQDKFEKNSEVENIESTEELLDSSFAKKEEDKEELKDNSESSEDKKEEDDEKKKGQFAKDDKEDEKEESSEDKKEKEEDEDKKKYALLEKEHNELIEKFSNLEAQYNDLLQFKLSVENEKKDALINSFYMLSDEDKKDVIDNKAQYSLDDIEAKLSIICVRKKVNFDLDDSSENKDITEESPITTFNLEEQASSTPSWILALRNTKNSRNA